jgi:hypothetical protein
MRYAGTLVVLLLFFGFTAGLWGQKPAAEPTPRAQLEATLGDGTVELSGLWKFHTGDNI